jgi:nucleotide-binding universal stress UspA family protein
MFKKILIAFDGSDHARRAARIAGGLARQQPDAELCLVIAVNPVPVELGEPFISDLISERENTGSALMVEARALIGEGIPIQEELLFGTPAESILEAASTHGCDLIIMGTRGLGALSGLLLGSQVQKVINLADAPVLAVK